MLTQEGPSARIDCNKFGHSCFIRSSWFMAVPISMTFVFVFVNALIEWSLFVNPCDSIVEGWSRLVVALGATASPHHRQLDSLDMWNDASGAALSSSRLDLMDVEPLTCHLRSRDGVAGAAPRPGPLAQSHSSGGLQGSWRTRPGVVPFLAPRDGKAGCTAVEVPSYSSHDAMLQSSRCCMPTAHVMPCFLCSKPLHRTPMTDPSFSSRVAAGQTFRCTCGLINHIAARIAVDDCVNIDWQGGASRSAAGEVERDGCDRPAPLDPLQVLRAQSAQAAIPPGSAGWGLCGGGAVPSEGEGA